MKKDRTFGFQGRIYELRHLAEEKITVAIMPSQKLYVLKNERNLGAFPI